MVPPAPWQGALIVSRSKVNAQVEEPQFTATYYLCVKIAGKDQALGNLSGEHLSGNCAGRMAVDANTDGCQAGNAPASSSPQAPIDLTHLRRFTLGDQHLELEVLNLFIDQTPVTIAALRTADSDRDWVNAAHTLKGSARAVGAWRLAKLAERAERLGTTADREACERLLAHLDDSVAEARAYIAGLGTDI